MDVKVAEIVFGLGIGSLKGEMTHQWPLIVESPIKNVPGSILKQCQEIVLWIDILSNKPLLVSISWNIKFGTIEAIQNFKSNTIIQSIKSNRNIVAKSRQGLC